MKYNLESHRIENQGNIRNEYLTDLVYTNPLGLLLLNNPKDIDFVNNLLPYSTGFEIECAKSKSFNNDNFKRIPHILDVDISDGEQRFRIPNGINGFLCLRNICIQLKLNSELNLASGIHYHVDCVECISKLIISKDLTEEILKELDTWNYKGRYNLRGIDLSTLHYWIRKNDLGTLEFRIGEMSFDYEVLVKRIIHANNIVRRIKLACGFNEVKYVGFDKQSVLDYIKNSITDIKDIEKKPNINPHKIVNNRTTKI